MTDSRVISQWSGIFIPAVAVCLLMLPTLDCSAEATKNARVPSALRHHPSFPVGRIVVLSGDNLLIWHRDGRAQLRDPNRGWSEVFQLPIEEHNLATPDSSSGSNRREILEIVPDDEDLLILEEPASLDKGYSVLLTNLNGKVLDRWIIHHYSLAITSDKKGRRVLTVDGMVPLLPKGILGVIEPFPSDYSYATSHQNPLLLEWQGVTIFCRNANLALAHYAPVQCQRIGEGGWQLQEGSGMAQPPMCGPWLLIWDEKHEKRLTVRSLVTGRVLFKRDFSQRPVAACAEQEGILIGGQSLELLSLPTLATRWHLPIVTGRIENIALLKQYIAYKVAEDELGNQSEIVLVARPQSP